MLERFKIKRQGALGALMDLYEAEADLFIETINQRVKDDFWNVVVDKETKDEDCRSIKSICEHIIGAANYYIELMIKGENNSHEISKFPILLKTKESFEADFKIVLEKQIQHFEGRWTLSDEDIEKIVIKTGWGNILDPESLMEHAILHIMRHHRQVLKYIQICEESIVS